MIGWRRGRHRTGPPRRRRFAHHYSRGRTFNFSTEIGVKGDAASERRVCIAGLHRLILTFIKRRSGVLDPEDRSWACGPATKFTVAEASQIHGPRISPSRRRAEFFNARRVVHRTAPKLSGPRAPARGRLISQCSQRRMLLRFQRTTVTACVIPLSSHWQ